MAYFKNLFPELQDQQVRKPAEPGGPAPYEQKEQYPTNPTDLFSGYTPTQESIGQETAAAGQVRQQAPAPAPEEGPNVKAQYNQAQQSKMQGWNEALKLSTDVDADIEKVKLENEGLVQITPKDENDLKGIIEKIGSKTERPSMLADDLRVIAARRTVSPVWSQKLLKAASMLDQADKADQYIEGLKKPGGPLAITQAEGQKHVDAFAGRIDQQKAGLAGAGSLRTAEAAPNLVQDERELAKRQENLAAIGPVTDDPPDFNSVLTASGWTKGDFMKRALALQSTLGLNMSQAIAPGAAGMAIANMLKSMGSVGQQLMGQMLKDSKRGQQAPGGGGDPNKKPGAEGMPDPYEARIRDQEMQYQVAFKELKQLKAFDSMWDVVFYVLFSLMMGPGPAAVLFTNKGKRGQLQDELEMYQKEIDSLARRGESHRRMQEDARRYAADREFAERKFGHQVDKDEFYMKLRAESPAGKDQVLENLMGGYRLWQDELDEAEKVLSNQFSFSDQEIQAARQKRARALPNVQKARANIAAYRAQNLQKAQGGEVSR